MKNFRIFRNRYLILSDVVLLTLAVLISFLLRLEVLNWDNIGSALTFFTALALIVTVATFYKLGVYSRYWPYASVDEMLLMVVAVSVATLIASLGYVIGGTLFSDGSDFPRSIPFIYFPFALGGTAGPRFAIRLLAQRRRRKRLARALSKRPKASLKNVLIVGAGDAGSMMGREIQNNPDLGLDLIGFLDDDSYKLRAYIHGAPVMGTRHDLERVVTAHKISQVIIAMPTAPGQVIREIARSCERLAVATRILPAMHEIIANKASVSQLRDVDIEDLLRREPIQTDISAVHGLISGKRVLVTGGGGSIGSELCRQVLRLKPATLIVMGHGENSVFEICNELNRKIAIETDLASPDKSPQICPVIADIRFIDRVQTIFEQHKPEIVFHAAAHKHVPLMESNPIEAASNNVLGTWNLLQVAAATGVEQFVMISTDKAVRPTSVMGATKRLAELLVHQVAAQIQKPYVAVRFGNVLGSRGSVVLTFKQQIAAGGPVTVTHPEMRRFFMTIPEAVQLVLQAAVLGQGGEVFMLEMGEPVKIVDLARDLIELSGLEVGKDIDIVYSGIRPGEKMFEELFVSGESYHPTNHEKIFSVAQLNDQQIDWQSQAITQIEAAITTNDATGLLQILREAIPEYRSSAESVGDRAYKSDRPDQPIEVALSAT
jgi:FlaA1/EpsC-like NDP-sugar epimerase